MRPWAKVLICLIFLTILSALYFFRDFVFVNANGHMEHLRVIQNNEYADLIINYTHSRMIEFFGDWSIEQILNFKWYMTLAFTLTFAIITSLGILLIKHRKIALWGLFFYGISFLLAFLISFFAYPVSRQIIGLLHSPVPFLLLIATAQLKHLIESQNE